MAEKLITIQLEYHEVEQYIEARDALGDEVTIIDPLREINDDEEDFAKWKNGRQEIIIMDDSSILNLKFACDTIITAEPGDPEARAKRIQLAKEMKAHKREVSEIMATAVERVKVNGLLPTIENVNMELEKMQLEKAAREGDVGFIDLDSL